MKFKVILEKEGDGGYSVTVPTLEGCYSQGDTFEEAIENTKDAIEGFIETLKAHNQPIPVDEELIFTDISITIPDSDPKAMVT